MAERYRKEIFVNNITFATLGFLAISSQVYAQSDPAEVCKGILPDAGRNVSVSQGSDAVLNTVFDKYCNQSGTTKSSSLDIGASAVIEDVPASFTLGTTDKQTAVNNFCRNYAQVAASNHQRYTYQSTVVSKALDTLDQCVRIARTGNFLTHKLLNDEAADIYLTAQTGGKITLQGVYVTGNVNCQTKLVNAEKAVQLTADSSPEFQGNLVISCHRSGESVTASPGSVQPGATAPITPVGSTIYNEATVTVGTVNAGSYGFLWPRAVRLPENEAAQVNADLAALRDTISKTNADLAATRAELNQVRSRNVFTNRQCHEISWINNVNMNLYMCPSGEYLAGVRQWKTEAQTWAVTCCPGS